MHLSLLASSSNLLLYLRLVLAMDLRASSPLRRSRRDPSGLAGAAGLPRASPAFRKRDARSVGIFTDPSGQEALKAFLVHLSHLILQQCLQTRRTFYVLCGVDIENFASADIIDRVARKRVLQSLSTNGSVNIAIVDLQKLKGLLGWSWDSIQNEMFSIKNAVQFILYYKGDGQLKKAIEDLGLSHLYLLVATRSDTVEANHPPECKVEKAGSPFNLTIDNSTLGRQGCWSMAWCF